VNTHVSSIAANGLFFILFKLLGDYYYYYYTRLTAIFQDNLGKLVPER